MKILIAPDSLKGSLSAKDTAACIRDSFINELDFVECFAVPLADGGEGSLDALQKSMELDILSLAAYNCNNKECIANVGVNAHKKTALIELAQVASKIPNMKEPLERSTYGVGHLIKKLVGIGYVDIYLTLGGSATVDAGLGALSALGYTFYNQEGALIEPLAKNILSIQKIGERPTSSKFKLHVLHDVNGFLTGPKGAAMFFEQKGVSHEESLWLQNAHQHWQTLLMEYSGRDITKLKGGAAAGGIGVSLYALEDSIMYDGAFFILNQNSIEELVQQVDLVVTAEGKLDEQSLMGKLPYQLSQLAKKYDKKCLTVVGSNQLSSHLWYGDIRALTQVKEEVVLSIESPCYYIRRCIKSYVEEVF